MPGRGGSSLRSTGARTLVEASAERQMEVAARLNHTRKVHMTAAMATSRQLRRVEPEVEEILRAFDIETAGTMSEIYRRTVG